MAAQIKVRHFKMKGIPFFELRNEMRQGAGSKKQEARSDKHGGRRKEDGAGGEKMFLSLLRQCAKSTHFRIKYLTWNIFVHISLVLALASCRPSIIRNVFTPVGKVFA